MTLTTAQQSTPQITLVKPSLEEFQKSLDRLPGDARFTPVREGKKPYLPEWHVNPLSLEEVLIHYIDPQTTGVGLLTGEASGGIVVLDFDGPSAVEALVRIAGCPAAEALSKSLKWTSGRPGRCQIAYRVSEETRQFVNENSGFTRKAEKTSGKGEQLEIRYNKSQSVLPPSWHPETERYQWVDGPDTPIAPAPPWLEDYLRNQCKPSSPSVSSISVVVGEPKDAAQMQLNINKARDCLHYLKEKYWDDYDNWIKVGMALHSVSQEALLEDWIVWSEKSDKFKQGECEERWGGFREDGNGVGLGTLVEMATVDGRKHPDIKMQAQLSKGIQNIRELEKLAQIAGGYVAIGAHENEAYDTLLEKSERAGIGKEEAERAIHEGLRVGKESPAKPKLPGATGNSAKLSILGEPGNPQTYDQRLVRLLEDTYAPSVRFNRLTALAEYKGQPLEGFATLEKEIIEGLGRCNISLLERQIIRIAREQSYHPVQEYLEELEWDGIPRISQIAPHCLDVKEDPNGLYSAYLKLWLVYAVARVYEPGCKADNLLVLQGKQGIGKTTFFRILGKEDWFTNFSFDTDQGKDGYLKLAQSWIVECGELESFIRKRDSGVTKDFLSNQVDKVRPPYGRTPVDMPRQCILCGTTNDAEFLRDPTGNRRFWIIPAEAIDTDWLGKNVDQIWAEAVHLYKGQYKEPGSRRLTAEQEAECTQRNEDYMPGDSVTEAVSEYIKVFQNKQLEAGGFKLLDVRRSLEDSLGISRVSDSRITNSLKKLGCTRRRTSGERLWVAPPPDSPE